MNSSPLGVDADSAPSGASYAIEASGVRRAFGSVLAVADANLAVEAGKVTALIGPNGCGKTTLMLMLAGLLKPDAGRIRVAGLDPLAAGAQARTSVGWMPDILGTWDSMKCLETLTYFGRAYGMTKEQARARGEELLALVHLGEFADRPARVLSRGQKQRLSLARSLIHDPAVLLLDEPASGLDPRSRVELREVIRTLASQGKAVLVSSHVLTELDEMVDDAIFMSKGVTLGEEADDMVALARQQYRVTALDDAALREALAGLGRPVEPGTGVTLRIVDEQEAAAVLADLVRAGVAVTSFGPVGSALEQTYLAMNEERR